MRKSVCSFPRLAIRRALCSCFVFGAVLVSASCAWGLETVTLQLKWSHAFQFAGYYAAKEKGYYRDIGLDVYFREAGPGVDPMEPVLAGQAQFGVGTSSLLLARKSGKPVVVLAVVFQHSPLVLVARQMKEGQGVQTIHDLVGRRIMIEPQSDELLAYFKQEGIPLDQLRLQHHTFNPQALIDGQVDAMSAYVTNETYDLEKAGTPYQVYSPRAAGIDFYGDNLFTTESEIRLHPGRVRAFREASLRGWQYAMAHPEEIADLIASQYARQRSRDHFLYEAKRMVPLLRTDLIEVGYMTHGRWRHIADTYADLGLLPRDYSLEGFLFNPESATDHAWLYYGLGLSLLVLVGGFQMFRLKRALARSMVRSAELDAGAERDAWLDPQTGLPGRQLLKDRLNCCLADIRRYGGRGALVFIRLTEPGNDKGALSARGPAILAVTEAVKHCVRDADTVARIGDFQLAILLARLDGDDGAVRDRVQAVIERVAQWPHKETAAESNAQSGETPWRIDTILLDGATTANEIFP